MPAASSVPPTPLTQGARRILDTASMLFYAHGIHAVGVDRIAAEAGVTKKTLYNRFGSKEALVIAYLRKREEQWRAILSEHLERNPEPGIDRVLAPFDAAQSWYPGRSTKGCSAVNARAEEGPDPTGILVAEEVTEQKQWMTNRFTELCIEAGLHQAELLGRQLQLLLDGALVTLGTAAFDSPLLVARDAARQLLQSANETRSTEA
ncbi:TetR/AcrR family transcriptional regulator [Mycolicibacterium goodii]|uniref:TetR/AcrR family transcriptional regulator n=1 Tax=Mycolicibacterium goodii TaxID=134601 RepID=UPI000C2628E2|nr:TetR/AcrR family transcriptional regulator [Mycolicibacterium goodii]PJK18204.1 TetR family transcriptional regulator [Mycolicibacterium goodii]